MLNLAGLIISVSYILMAIGYLSTIIYAAGRKEYKKTFFLVVIPFYVFRYILRMEENQTKKMLAVSTMGAFTFFVLASIFKIIMTPPL